MAPVIPRRAWALTLDSGERWEARGGGALGQTRRPARSPAGRGSLGAGHLAAAWGLLMPGARGVHRCLCRRGSGASRASPGQVGAASRPDWHRQARPRQSCAEHLTPGGTGQRLPEEPWCWGRCLAGHGLVGRGLAGHCLVGRCLVGGSLPGPSWRGLFVLGLTAPGATEAGLTRS